VTISLYATVRVGGAVLWSWEVWTMTSSGVWPAVADTTIDSWSTPVSPKTLDRLSKVCMASMPTVRTNSWRNAE
jgi:hypothetical protein